jgi:hypothetical protein
MTIDECGTFNDWGIAWMDFTQGEKPIGCRWPGTLPDAGRAASPDPAVAEEALFFLAVRVCTQGVAVSRSTASVIPIIGRQDTIVVTGLGHPYAGDFP